MTNQVVHTHCAICEQLCGLDAEVAGGRVVSIRPDRKNPYTWRDFCVKGQRAGDVAHSPWRLRQPMRRLRDRYVAASYEEAVADVSARLQRIIERHGPNAVAGYSGNPHGFNFGSVAFHNAFLTAIGTHQIFTVQSIDTNAKYVATGRMFGLEMLPLIPDLASADCVFLIGANPAVSKFNWGGKVPNGWRMLKAQVRAGAELIVADPRRTETAEFATLHLAPLPEEDWALLLGMIKVILGDRTARLPAGEPVDGLEALETLAADVSLSRLAAICDVPAERIADAARRFSAAPRGFAFAATGPALGRNGALTHWLTLALNLITDRVDRPGGRFAPNWLNSVFARARQPSRPAVRSRVRGLAPVVGNHSVAELADEITTPGEGQVRALILAGGNPVSTAADGGRLDAALAQLELLVSVDLFQRESHRHAHWLIPGEHFLERSELHVGLHATNDRPFAQATRACIPAPDGVRPEWTFYRDVAEAIGVQLFGGAADDPDALAERMLASDGRVTLAQIKAHEHGVMFAERDMGHLWRFLRAEGRRVDLCPPDLADQLRGALSAPGAAPHRDEYRMISRRRNGMMNSSLTETSGMLTPDETAGSVEMNSDDAALAGLTSGDRVMVSSPVDAVEGRVLVSDDVRPGVVVMAHGWGSPLYDPATGEMAMSHGQARNKLVSDTDLDPLSAVPRLNGVRVRIALAEPASLERRPARSRALAP